MAEEKEVLQLQILLKSIQTINDLKLLLLLNPECSENWSQSCATCSAQLLEDADSSTDEESMLDSSLCLLDGVTVTFLSCKFCNKYASLWLNRRWYSIEDVLKEGSDDCHAKFSPVLSPVDHLRIFLLSQVCHNQQDLELAAGESPFLPPNPSDFSTLIWKDNRAVGFYSIKLKGTSYPGYPLSRYALNMIDTIYVRRSSRHLGIASSAISEVVLKFPGEDLGFSDPLSSSLIEVLCRYLSTFPKLRDRFWVCSFTGEVGYRWNVYLRMKSKILRVKQSSKEKKKEIEHYLRPDIN